MIFDQYASFMFWGGNSLTRVRFALKLPLAMNQVVRSEQSNMYGGVDVAEILDFEISSISSMKESHLFWPEISRLLDPISLSSQSFPSKNQNADTSRYLLCTRSHIINAVPSESLFSVPKLILAINLVRAAPKPRPLDGIEIALLSFTVLTRRRDRPRTGRLPGLSW